MRISGKIYSKFIFWSEKHCLYELAVGLNEEFELNQCDNVM